MKIGQILYDSRNLWSYEIVAKTENKKGLEYKLKRIKSPEDEYKYNELHNPTIKYIDGYLTSVVKKNVRFFSERKNAQIQHYSDELREAENELELNRQCVEASLTKVRKIQQRIQEIQGDDLCE